MSRNIKKTLDIILRAGKILKKVPSIQIQLLPENLLVILQAYDLTADKLENVTDALLTLDVESNTEAGALSEILFIFEHLTVIKQHLNGLIIDTAIFRTSTTRMTMLPYRKPMWIWWCSKELLRDAGFDRRETN